MLLTHPPSQIIARLIIDLALGTLPTTTATTWPVYVSNEPTNPDNAITVYDTMPVNDGRVMQGELQYHYGFQVRARSTTYLIGWLKLNNIQESLSEVDHEVITISGVQYLIHCVSGFSGVIALGTEAPESKRELFTLNALVTITRLN